MVGAAFWNPYLPEKTFVYNKSSKPLGPAEVGIFAEYLDVNGEISVDAAYRSLLSPEFPETCNDESGLTL